MPLAPINSTTRVNQRAPCFAIVKVEDEIHEFYGVAPDHVFVRVPLTSDSASGE